MRLTASDIVSLYRPEPCQLRVYLREHGVQEAEPGAFDEIIEQLGRRHEENHIASLGAHEDISVVEPEQRVARTLEAIQAHAPVIYQGEFRVQTAIDGTPVEIVGRPDYLIFDGDGYVIRDSKLSRKVDEKHHEEISLQVQLYGWLYEQAVGKPAKRLEVHTGSGAIVEVPYDGGIAALSKLTEVLTIKQMTTEPYEPVGWSKCGSCGFAGTCWPRALETLDVSLVMEVDQGLARQLHSDGIFTAGDLVGGYDAARLSELKRPWGAKQQKVGKKADRILLNAEMLATKQERLLAHPALPVSENFVMFDLEGLPPQLDDLEKVYLWGMQVFGKKPGEYLGPIAGFGIDGDRKGWEKFLQEADGIFSEFGDIPFVHWHHYEKTHIKMYVDRYGDPNGVAERVLQNLLDLLPITRESVVLPLPSYSLKVVEQHVGFKRTQDEYGGSWSMAQFILATETNDEAERNARMAEILKYNEEDLAATWAVFDWLRNK
ncbi:MAG TPA: TM0106 family RecB-like putative nuclease [Terracidiphilus sp.]|nr:TM0106 family RecB-like putative nuclease [Terracidiphilus sp.]